MVCLFIGSLPANNKLITDVYRFAQTALSIQLKKDKNAEDEADKQADELKSARALLSMKSNHIISDPREYQLELFERAKLGNTLAVLDTGSGKTLIATLLIRHILDQELEDRAAGKNPRVCIFLVRMLHHLPKVF